MTDHEVQCRCGLVYRASSIKKTRSFICAECAFDLRKLLNNGMGVRED